MKSAEVLAAANWAVPGGGPAEGLPLAQTAAFGMGVEAPQETAPKAQLQVALAWALAQLPLLQPGPEQSSAPVREMTVVLTRWKEPSQLLQTPAGCRRPQFAALAQTMQAPWAVPGCRCRGPLRVQAPWLACPA